MKNIIENILSDLCLDERVSDGIFKLDNDEHMSALREYVAKRGLSEGDAVQFSNKILEGRFPDRQAYNKDGILCTFPTPQHKQRAIQRGSHFEKNPAPQNTTPPKGPPPQSEVPPTQGGKPEVPVKEPSQEPVTKDTPSIADDGETDGKKVQQGDKELSVEPPKGDEKLTSKPIPTIPKPVAKTPAKVAAEKEITTQIINTDDTVLSNITPSMNEEIVRLYEYAQKSNLKEVSQFLQGYFAGRYNT